MARTSKKEESFENDPFKTDIHLGEAPNLNMETIVPVSSLIEKEKPEEETKKPEKKPSESDFVNCLRNEKIIVRPILRQTGRIDNPKHVLYGNMSNNAKRTFCVPKLTSGTYVNVLTDNEKKCLEYVLNLEPNALSVYRKTNNFWDDSNPGNISKVTLMKQDNILDLSNPIDYIKYKILLANKDFIAPSIQAYNDCPKITYQFVIYSSNDEVKSAKNKMTMLQKSYMEFGKIQDDFDKLRVIVEIISGKPVDKRTSLEWLQTKANEFIQADAKMFLTVITDDTLKFKVIIKKAVECGKIVTKGNQYYLRDGNVPLCDFGEDPVLSNAVKYLASPKNQSVLFALEAENK